MADVKVSGIPADTGLDDNHYVVLNDPVGPTTKTTTLGVLRAWLQSVATWVTSSMIDYSTMALNIKSATNGSNISPNNNGLTDFSGNGVAVAFTVAAACNAHVTVSMGCSSTSDFEYRPRIYLDGVLVQEYSPSAGAGNASNRSYHRGFSWKVPLTAGAHTISAGVSLNSATAASIAAGGATISAFVLGKVTA